MPRILLMLSAALLLVACGDETPDGETKNGDAGSGSTSSSPDSDTTPPANTAKGLPSPDGWPSADERRLRPDAEPSPFSAKQIAAGCGPDSRRVFRFEIEGQDTEYKLWTFHDQTPTGCVFVQSACDAQGVATGDPTENNVTWTELQSHASWPVANTTASEAKLKVPAGTYDCMHYVVTREGAQGTGVDKYWFAWDLPGPPIRMERLVNGRLKVTLTLMKIQGVGSK